MYIICKYKRFILHNPSVSFGTKLNAVLTKARTLQTTIRVQSKAFCEYVNSLPKSFRWNPQGRMIQIVKHAIAPISDIMRSKSGTRIARTTKETVQRRRTVTLRQPRVKPDIPVMAASAAIALASNPSEISIVLTIGLDVSGTFESGMIAMAITMRSVIHSG